MTTSSCPQRDGTTLSQPDSRTKLSIYSLINMVHGDLTISKCFYSKFRKVHLNTAWFLTLTHLSLASLLWDIGKQNSPRCDAAERGVPSGAILFAWRKFIKK